MKPTEIDLKSIISANYLMPENMLQAYVECINLAMPSNTSGRPRGILERILHGIFYVLRTGIQWRALPYVFGKPMTIYHWFTQLCQKGLFSETWTFAIGKLQERNLLKLMHQSLDSAHRKAPAGGNLTGPSPVDRRKLGTKIVIQADGQGIPIGLSIAASNQHDQIIFRKAFLDAMSRLKRQQDCTFLHTDKGFDSKKNAALVAQFSMVRIAPQRVYKKRKDTQKEIQKDQYRWVIERSISWFNRFKRVAMRNERDQKRYLAWVQLAAQTMCFSKL